MIDQSLHLAAPCTFTKSAREDNRGVDLISDAAIRSLGNGQVADAIDYPKFRRQSHRAVIRVYDDAGNVIETASRRETSRNREFFSSRHVALLG